MGQNQYIPNIPLSDKKRIVIVGVGFAGLKFLKKINLEKFQIVVIDKTNFHKFQPLLYQVATAGLNPSEISFPVRKILRNEKDVHFRIAEITEIHADKKEISTNIGRLEYDYLVLSIGATTNYFGQKNIEEYALAMKTVPDAILIRNTILEHFELALLETKEEKINEYLNIILVGGGPTGVELAGALANMKKYIFPKDYPDLDLKKMRIIIYEGSENVLSGMSAFASKNTLKYLTKLGVEVFLNTRVMDYNGACIKLSDGSQMSSKNVIWTAGIIANPINGLSADSLGSGNRIKVDRFNQVIGYKDIYALGDLCIMETQNYPKGHPQVAPVAIQQATLLVNNMHSLHAGKPLKKFEYVNKGSLATIGRNKAVANLPFIGNFKGFTAWFLWSFIHLIQLVGVENRLAVFINWSFRYFKYDQSLRLLFKTKPIIERKNSKSCNTFEKNADNI